MEAGVVNTKWKISLRFRVTPAFICDIALLFYLCVMFAHQSETTVDTLLRYGSLFFVVAAYVIVYYPQQSKYKEWIFKISGFEMWLLLFFAYGTLSYIWSIDSGNVYRVLFNLAKTMLVCFCIRPHLNSRKAIHHTLILLLIALFYMMVILVLRTPISVWGTERIGSVINQNSNEMGRLTCLGSLLTFYFLTFQKKHRLLLIALFGIFTVGVFMTGSKNAIFIFIFQIGLYYFLICGKSKRILVVVGIWIGIFLIFQLVMNNSVLYTLVGNRLERMFLLFTGGPTVDGSTSERLYFIETAWNLFRSHPILGVGLNNFSAYLASIGYHNAVYSHCGFLEILSTLGIIGFVIYYSMYGKVLVKLIRPAFKKDMLVAFLFILNLRVFLFDISSISLYTYNSYITLMLGFACTRVLQLEGDRG